jgi:hypothetical protein
MRLLIVLAVAVIALASTASAAPVCLTGGTLASYQALGSGGCMIGDLRFSNFSYVGTSQGQGSTVANTQVFLTPVGSGTLNPGPGIIFSSTGWSVPRAANNNDSFVDSTIGFIVSTISGSQVIDDGTLTLSSFTVTGTGVGHIAETINATSLQVDSGGPLVSRQVFALTNTVTVSKDLRVTVPTGNPNSGTAQINSFEEDFSEVPEPAASVLLGSGLLALGFWSRGAGLKDGTILVRDLLSWHL